MVVNRITTMGGRAGGGARSGGGGGAGRPSARFITLQGGKWGNVTINAKKTPKQVLAQANRLEKALTGYAGNKGGTWSESVGIAKGKVASLKKVKAAQIVSKIAKGTKV